MRTATNADDYKTGLRKTNNVPIMMKATLTNIQPLQKSIQIVTA